MTDLAKQIFKLHKEGLSYNKIAHKLGCSKSTVSYYINSDSKNKHRLRQQKRRKRHPFIAKTDRFRNRSKNHYIKSNKTNIQTKLKSKIEKFCADRKNKLKYQKPTFTLQDVIDKFGENPRCYLTGKLIDIYKPHTYHFDHIKPVSRGGDNSLDNLGICTKEANMAKNDLTVDELIDLCQQIIAYQSKN